MATPGEKAKGIVHSEVGDRKIIDEVAGNNRYIAVTDDIVYVGSVGAASGSLFGGKSVKKYPIDAITSIDVRKALLTVELEIVMPGSVETGMTHAGFMSKAQNENITMFPKSQYDRAQQIANLIMELRSKLKNRAAQQVQTAQSIPDQIRQLAGLRDSGILSEEEFEEKKKELLSRM